MVESLFRHQREFIASSCSDIPASVGSGLRIAEEIKRIQCFARAHVGRHQVYSDLYLLCEGVLPLVPPPVIDRGHHTIPGLGGTQNKTWRGMAVDGVAMCCCCCCSLSGASTRQGTHL